MILPIVKIVTDQEQRLARYESLIGMASCEEEKKALRKAYEISRLLFINDEMVMQRNNMMLRDSK